MRTAQYVKAEKDINAVDGGGIWERWRFGLRLLNDPAAMSTGNGGGLRHGVTDQLITAAQAKGLKLSDREIRWRLQCARTYPHASQIGNAVSDFKTWHDLVAARFPAYEAEPDEPPADYRTAVERRHDRAQQMALAVIDQARLFPLERFEPDEATLKDLIVYANEQDQITENFARTCRDRRQYLTGLLEAVAYDVSQTWQAAHRAAYGKAAS